MRTLFVALRRLISSAEKKEADEKIIQAVLSRPEWKKAETVCLYMATIDEVDTKPLLAEALQTGKIVVFPRIEKNVLVLRQVLSIKDFMKGPYQILEPKKSTPVVDPKSVDIFIVPGVAFDRHGYRLGYGKGYYDKLLENKSAPKIGLAYSVQLVAKLPHSSYDVPMTMVVTDEETI